mmetsp:Transcript_29837/g.63279  ORF Transcript_29837/g.63279 Transcript_29837/m.63279 type:complete len:229 (-) Transcript_29837:380-1066(-)|eukprot:CAMPEP_0172320630 /NCGR_PEP_ID=MMETSP1058-20130122/40983_1 /TAXON_ID=83371 /ORGANISM="Detonula confervacea, Strain CCMP 353" /LENGTH=228 /DNA_ID=CAMNT_0013035927 /DNA_START=59 /DNA_END=745 /DNA_ORIENTATION=-
MGGIHSSSKNKAKPPTKKGGTITPIDRATLDLKISRDRLSKYRTKLASDSDKLAARAKSLHAEGNTKNALQLLRLRKYKLQEADRVEEQLMTVLRMVDKISEKQNEQEVVQAMKVGKDALQIMHEKMGIDGVLDLMDEIRDQDEVEKQINEMLGQEGLTVMEELGEEDVLAELEQLEEEVRLEEEKQKASGERKDGDVVLPAVPIKPLPAVEEPIKPEPTKANVAVAS